MNVGFYVSVVRGSDYRLLAGPFKTHKEALSNVGKFRMIAMEHDPKAVWYYFGTVRVEQVENLPSGIFPIDNVVSLR